MSVCTHYLPMMIQITASRGGIGTSAFAFSLASAERNPTLLLDLSHHRGGIRWVSGAGDINTSWPTFFGERWSENLSMQFERLMFTAGNIGIFSGGAVPPENIVVEWIRTQSEKLVVVDGNDILEAFNPVVIHHSTNSLQEWNAFSGDTDRIFVIQLRLGGLPKKYFIDELGLTNAFFYVHQKAVRNSLELGMGVHPSSKVSKVAKSVLEHVKN